MAGGHLVYLFLIAIGGLLALVVKAVLPAFGMEGLQPVIIAAVLYGMAGAAFWRIYRFLVEPNDQKQWWQELGIIAAALVAPLLVLEGGGRVTPHIADLWDALGNM